MQTERGLVSVIPGMYTLGHDAAQTAAKTSSCSKEGSKQDRSPRPWCASGSLCVPLSYQSLLGAIWIRQGRDVGSTFFIPVTLILAKMYVRFRDMVQAGEIVDCTIKLASLEELASWNAASKLFDRPTTDQGHSQGRDRITSRIGPLRTDKFNCVRVQIFSCPAIVSSQLLIVACLLVKLTVSHLLSRLLIVSLILFCWQGAWWREATHRVRNSPP